MIDNQYYNASYTRACSYLPKIGKNGYREVVEKETKQFQIYAMCQLHFKKELSVLGRHLEAC